MSHPFGSRSDGNVPPPGRATPKRDDGTRRTRHRGRRHRLLWLSGSVVALLALVGAIGPLVVPNEPNVAVAPGLLGPTGQHPFGTDELGRDLLSRVLYGTRISLEIGIGAALAAGFLGTFTGLYAGLRRGWPDSVIMRVQDFLLGFPPLILAMIIVAIFGASMFTPLVAAIVVFFPLFARVIRASTLVERNKEYVLASRALGASERRILVRTMLPSVLPVVWVQCAIVAAVAIQLEAALSFLGVGVPPPTPSLGSMLFSAQGFLGNAPLYGVFAGLVLTVLIGALVLFANALESRESVSITKLEIGQSGE